MQSKKKIYTDSNGDYFLYKGKHYIKDIDSRGYDKKQFKDGKYTGIFRVVYYEAGYVAIEEKMVRFKVI